MVRMVEALSAYRSKRFVGVKLTEIVIVFEIDQENVDHRRFSFDSISNLRCHSIL